MTAPPPLPGPAQQDAIANRALLFVEFGRQAEARAAFEAAAKSFSAVVRDPVRPD